MGWELGERAASIAVRKVIPAMQQGAWSEISAIASRDFDKAQRAAQRIEQPHTRGRRRQRRDLEHRAPESFLEIGPRAVGIAQAQHGRDSDALAGVGSLADGITRPINGEAMCGDAYAVRVTDGSTFLMLCDGSGHGPLAATASREAVRVFHGIENPTPETALRQIHRALSGTR
jgi:hypothetical protein